MEKGKAEVYSCLGIDLGVAASNQDAVSWT